MEIGATPAGRDNKPAVLPRKLIRYSLNHRFYPNFNSLLMVYNGVESLRLYEVAPRTTRIDHSIAFGTINVSQAAWSRLSEADRKVMLAAGDEIVVWAAEETNKRLSQTIERMQSKGAQFCTPNQAEFARLVSAVDKVVDSNRNQVSPDGAAIIKVVDQYRSRVRSGPTIGPNNPCKK